MIFRLETSQHFILNSQSTCIHGGELNNVHSYILCSLFQEFTIWLCRPFRGMCLRQSTPIFLVPFVCHTNTVIRRGDKEKVKMCYYQYFLLLHVSATCCSHHQGATLQRHAQSIVRRWTVICTMTFYTAVSCYIKGKAIPIQAWTGR